MVSPNEIDIELAKVRLELKQLTADRDGWRIYAGSLAKQLDRIYSSPAWRISKPLRILNLIFWRFQKPAHLEFEGTQTPSNNSKVLDLVSDQLKIEHSNAHLQNSKIAILAQWSQSVEIRFSTLQLILELMENAFEVVVVSACSDSRPLQIPGELANKIHVVRKPNKGYDFGSWCVGIEMIPDLDNVDELLLINDSLSGPFDSLNGIFDSLRDSLFDITGITDSLQLQYHVQSYLLHFKRSALANKAIPEFFRNVRHLDAKQEVIHSYELGLTRIAQANGLLVGAIYPWNLITTSYSNPTIDNYENLLNKGFPMVKWEVVRSMSLSRKLELASIISDTFGMELHQVHKLLEIKL